MTSAGNGSSSGQDFEQTLGSSDSNVASFDHDRKSPIERVQHFLHGNPTMVPVIVLLISVAIFGLLAGASFFRPST